MPDAGRESDLLVIGQQAENHLVVAMLSDGLQENLEKLLDGPGLVSSGLRIPQRNRHDFSRPGDSGDQLILSGCISLI